jgi:hypothetical protein
MKKLELVTWWKLWCHIESVKNGQESPIEPLCFSRVLSDKHRIWKSWLLDAKLIGLYNVHCKSKHLNKTHTTSKLRYENNSFITNTYQLVHIIVVCTLPSLSLMTFFNTIILSNFNVDVLKSTHFRKNSSIPIYECQ